MNNADTATKHAEIFTTELRGKILANDMVIMEALLKRTKLVKQLWAFKERRGIPRIDEKRERELHTMLRRANGGRLSNETLDSLVDYLLDATKKELV